MDGLKAAGSPWSSARRELTCPVSLRACSGVAPRLCGEAIARDLERVIERLQNRPDWLERCMQVMAMSLPKAVLWSKIRALRRGAG